MRLSHQGTLRRHGDGRSGAPPGRRRAPCPWPRSPTRQEISLSYLEQLFARLRRGGPGARACAAPAAATAWPRRPARRRCPRSCWPSTSRCAPPAAPAAVARAAACWRGERCITHDLWEDLGRQIHHYLASVSPGRRGRAARLGAPRPAAECGVSPSISTTTPPPRSGPRRAEAVAAALADSGNPSSVHAAGRARARARSRRRARQVAALVGADPAAVIFTSGGTEANALAIDSARRGGLRPADRRRHRARRACSRRPRRRGMPVEMLPVDARRRRRSGLAGERLAGAAGRRAGRGPDAAPTTRPA